MKALKILGWFALILFVAVNIVYWQDPWLWQRFAGFIQAVDPPESEGRQPQEMVNGGNTWDVVLEVNLRGPFLFTKHAAAQFIKQGEGGRIINIASQAAKSPAPLLVHYTSSKHGMIGLTRTAAAELGEHGITVNAVCPNHVTTGLGAVQNARRGQVLGTDTDGVLDFRKAKIPLGRVGLTSDTANACVFLASDEAAYITGEAMNVSGGEEMH